MAVEARRGCGYRKVGGLYLMGDGRGVECDRLPLPLTICPCCSQGIKQARSWTWIDVALCANSAEPPKRLLVGGVHRDCRDSFPCPLCMATEGMGKAGLLWIGARFYSTPADFSAEADRLGISRRVAAVPRNFVAGETWVLLAHPKGMTCPKCAGGGLHTTPGSQQHLPCDLCDSTGKVPAIFRVFRPTRIEKIITETQAQDAGAMAELERRGITPVVVPDNDPDHQGSVYDDDQDDNGTVPMFEAGAEAAQ
jgi:hypothetical protein